MVADEEGSIMGFLSVTTKGFVERTGVLPKFRGRGLQREMIRCAMKRFNKLRTYTRRDTDGRISAWNFVECGFKYVRKSDEFFYLSWKRARRRRKKIKGTV